MKRFFVSCFILLSAFGFAQDGSSDDLSKFLDVSPYDDTIREAAVSSSGRIVLLGTSNELDGNENDTDFMVAMFENGDIDTSFGVDGYIIKPRFELSYRDIEAVADEKILVHGQNDEGYYLSRLNPDGSIDASFAENGYVYPYEEGSFRRNRIVQEDGKIVYTLNKNIDDINHVIIKRFTENGFTDTTFGIDGRLVLSTQIDSNSLLPSNDIQIQYTDEGNLLVLYRTIDESYHLKRILSNNTVDINYASNGIYSIPAELMSIPDYGDCKSNVFEDESTLISCNYYTNQGQDLLQKAIKVTPMGTFDSTFGVGGYIDGIRTPVIQKNQRIVVTRFGTDWEGGYIPYMKRYFQNGAEDISFEFNYQFLPSFGQFDFMITNKGKLLLFGATAWYHGPTLGMLHRYKNSPLGVQENVRTNPTIYPNPSSGVFNLKLASFTSEIPYQITDVTGKIIQEGYFSEAENQIDISTTANGIYFLTSNNSSYRLIKE